jgi:hypothetical protein
VLGRADWTGSSAVTVGTWTVFATLNITLDTPCYIQVTSRYTGTQASASGQHYNRVDVDGVRYDCQTITMSTGTMSSSGVVSPGVLLSAGTHTIVQYMYYTGGSFTAASRELVVNGPLLASANAPPPGDFTWHDARPLLNSWVGTISGYLPPQYRMTSDSNFVEVVGWIKSPPTTGNYNSVNIWTMPAAYRPSTNSHAWQIGGAADGAASPRMSVLSNGNVIINFLPASLAQTQLSIWGRYPLDGAPGFITS